MGIAALTAPAKRAFDFNAREITGAVTNIRRPGEAFAIVQLDNGAAIVGELEPDDLAIGCTYRFWGVWTVHARWGQQFRASSCVLVEITGQLGVTAYLSRSGLGLTSRQAQSLWKKYGITAVEALRERPEQAASDCNIPADVAQAASVKLQSDLDSEPTKIELFELFAGRGIPRAAVSACVRTWGANAPAVIKRDPFQLVTRDIPGIGFKRADALYLDLGHNPHRLKRQFLAGWHALHKGGSGNTWEPLAAFYGAVLRAIGDGAAERFDDAIALGTRAKWLARREESDADGGNSTPWLAEAGNAAAELRLAKHIQRIRRHATRWPALDTREPVSDHQRDQVNGICGSALAILAGTPGTGKTYTAAALLRVLVHTLHEQHRIKVCAPTGKAAVRIAEQMERYQLPLKATTIHTLLGVAGQDSDGGFQFAHDESNPLEESLIVVDEASMLDVPTAAALLAAVPNGGNVLFVGDPYQLPPVGHGAPLRDMIAAGVPCALLTEVRRNAGAIVNACRGIKDGAGYAPVLRIDLESGENLAHVEAEGDTAQLEAVILLLAQLKANGFNPVWDVQIIVPRNAGSAVGRRLLNDRLQDVLNPVTAAAPQVNNAFRLGDKVICLKNSQLKTVEPIDGAADRFRPTGVMVTVANGDQGRVMLTEKTAVVVQFTAPSRIASISTAKAKPANAASQEAAEENAASGRAGDFDLAYGITGHKSQGSEWPVVIVVCDDNAGPVASREWIYTAISRAGKLCITVGRFASIGRMIGRVTLAKRKTFLRELLTEEKR